MDLYLMKANMIFVLSVLLPDSVLVVMVMASSVNTNQTAQL